MKTYDMPRSSDTESQFEMAVGVRGLVRFAILLSICWSRGDLTAATAAIAPVPRDQVRETVLRDIASVLHAASAASDQPVPPEIAPRIELRARLISLTINALPLSAMDQGVAAWIDASIVDRVRASSLLLLEDSPAEDAFLRKFRQRISTRLKSLTSERERLMLRQRDERLAELLSWRREIAANVIRRVRNAKSLRVYVVSSGHGASFAKMVAAMGLAETAASAKDRPAAALRPPTAVEAAILEVLLLRDVRDSIVEQTVPAIEEASNLFSANYDAVIASGRGPTHRPPTGASAESPSFTLQWAKDQSDTVLVDLGALQQWIDDRWVGSPAQSSGHQAAIPSFCTGCITFPNDSSLLELLDQDLSRPLTALRRRGS